MYDPKCYELAEYFLDGETGVIPADIDCLAQNIQDEIEMYLSARKSALTEKS